MSISYLHLSSQGQGFSCVLLKTLLEIAMDMLWDAIVGNLPYAAVDPSEMRCAPVKSASPQLNPLRPS